MKRKFVGIENLTSKALKRLPDNKILEYVEMYILIGDTIEGLYIHWNKESIHKIKKL